MKALALAGLLSALVTSVPLCAQPYPVPPTWGGDFGSRPRLTGDWGGTRDELGKKGVVLDADVYWFPQQVVSGGKDTGGGGWGNAILTLNADTQNFVPFLRNTFGLGLNHEDAVELYYSAAVTPWLTVSPSLQVLRSGLNKALDPSSNLNNLDTAYLAGVRVGIRF